MTLETLKATSETSDMSPMSPRGPYRAPLETFSATSHAEETLTGDIGLLQEHNIKEVVQAGTWEPIYEVTLPWPPSVLNPNRRHGHWGPRVAAARRYRATCRDLARDEVAARRPDVDDMRAHAEAGGAVVVEVRFVPPDRRPRDLDNALASLKAGLDGLADALQINDARFRLALEMAGEVGGMVKVKVKKVNA